MLLLIRTFFLFFSGFRRNVAGDQEERADNSPFASYVYAQSTSTHRDVNAGLRWGYQDESDIQYHADAIWILKRGEGNTVTLKNVYTGLYMGKYDKDCIDPVRDIQHHEGDTYLMMPDDKGNLNIELKANSFKPYIGVGYELPFKSVGLEKKTRRCRCADLGRCSHVKSIQRRY